MSEFKHYLGLASVFVVMVASMPTGCGLKSPPFHDVQGFLRFEGKPVIGAKVTLQSMSSGPTSTASGVTDENGRFVLWTGTTEGCRAGRYRVQVELSPHEHSDSLHEACIQFNEEMVELTVDQSMKRLEWNLDRNVDRTPSLKTQG